MKDLSDIVKKVLEDHEDARDSDFRTIGWVYKTVKPSVMDLPFKDVLWNHKKYDIPSFETIRRTRQKVQHDNPSLRGKTYLKRMAKQTEYIEKFADMDKRWETP